jgi:hypothetical protein
MSVSTGANQLEGVENVFEKNLNGFEHLVKGAHEATDKETDKKNLAREFVQTEEGTQEKEKAVAPVPKEGPTTEDNIFLEV